MNIGGIGGRIVGSIINCHHIGSVTATGTSSSWITAGGICGAVTDMEKCTQSNGTIKVTANDSGSRDSDHNIGGLTGYMMVAPSYNSLVAQIHTSKVESTTVEWSSNKSYGSAMGTLVGSISSGKIYDCSTATNTTLIKNGTTVTDSKSNDPCDKGHTQP